jgi:hypothetical protein
MRKTTVYVPDDLKRALELMARMSGRSEAQLIRDAIAAMTGAAHPPRPRGSLFASGDPSLSARVDEALSGFGAR